MKTLQPTQTWILICLMTVVSSGTTEHAPPHHDATQHGDSTTHKRPQNTIVPFGIQIPEHVLSTQDVACISADDNIFQIMNEAQKTCNGTDMRCTFYHFVNHDYENMGTLDVNKESFDDLLMKFDNWLLTAENIDKNDVYGKTKEGSSVDTASINVNDRYENEGKVAKTSNASKANGQPNQGTVDYNISESNDDIIHGHHTKNPDETHHKNHHHKWKNGNHIKLDTEYNNEHRYFEVFLPKDKETGRPRTIYVEVDRDKNEFVLLDEEIDKKLNGIKPMKIELDELSEIADTAFSNLVKSSYHKGRISNNLDEEDRVMTSDLNTYSTLNDHEIHLDIDADEQTQNILNSSVYNPNICNINANQLLISHNNTGNLKKVINVSKNLVVPNKYINQAQFHVESHINNTKNIMPNNNFEIVQNINETDFNGKGLFNTIEFDHNNIAELNINNAENSLEFIKIPCETENRNCTENNEFSIEHQNITYDENDFNQLVENNDTSNDINFKDSRDFASSNTEHFKDNENKPILTHDIYVKPDSTTSVTAGMSDNTDSLKHLFFSENQEGQTDLKTHSLVSSIPISSFTTIPVLGKDLAKVVEMDSNLQSSFPVYATFNLSASDSQNSHVHPTVTCHNSPLDSVHGQQTSSPNFGVSWPSSYSPIEEFGTPCAAKSLGSTSTPTDSILPITQLSKYFSGNPESISPDHLVTVEDPRLFPNLPSLSFDVQKPCLFPSQLHLDVDTLTSPKNLMPTNVDIPSTTPSSVIPNSPIEVVNSPCPFPPLSPNLQPTKDNLGYSNPPCDINLKDTTVPYSGNRNRYPCNTIPYFLNPYLKPPQFIAPYFDPQPLKTPCPTTSKIPAFESAPLYLDQSYPCLNTDYPRETKPMPLFPFGPNTPFSPLNPPWLGSSFIPITCPSLWNNIPYKNMPSSPSPVLSAQNMWNYQPTLNNYLAPPMDLQQSQFLKPSPTTEAAKSIVEDSYTAKNILQMTPLTYPPLLSVYQRPVQMDLNPSFSLERDLQTLSCKYGIPLSKILNSLEAEIYETRSKSLSPFESPCSILKHGSYTKGKTTSSATNAAVNDENRTGNEDILIESDLANLIPLDSSLIGPHLDMDNSALQGSNNYQTFTVASETTGQPKQMLKDSSLIGPHLSTISTSNFRLSDEDRIGNTESDSSSLMPLDLSLIGHQLKIRPSDILDSDISQGNIVTSHTEVPGTLLSKIKTKLNIQNKPAKLSLDGSFKGPHLATLSKAKPLLSDEIQSINDMMPLESDFIEVTPLDSSQVDLVNKLEQPEILQHEKTAVTFSASQTDSTKLFKPVETKPNLIEDVFLYLDSSLIGPHLQTESSIIHTDSVEQKTVPEKTQDSLQNANELKSIILPPSMLPKLLTKPVPADSNLNVHSQNAQLNEEHSEILGTNADLPITHISLITPSAKETDFQILEPTLVQLKNIKQNLKSPGIIQETDSKTQLDGYFQDLGPHHKIKTTEIWPNLHSSIQLDNSLIGPSILDEIDSREMSPIFDFPGHPKSSIGNKFVNQNKTPLKVPAAIDSEIEYDNSLSGPTSDGEIKSYGSSISSNFITQLDNSLIAPNLDETIGSSATSSVPENKSQLQSPTKGHGLIPEMETIDESRAFDSKYILDSSLVGPHLSTASFSIDEIKMINKELQLESDLAHFKPLDSSLMGSHLGFESQLDESEISRYQNPELSDLVEEESPLQRNAVPTVYPSDLQELLSKFTNAITKSHLLPSEMNPCDKLLSSKGQKSPVSKNIPFEDLQTYTQFSSQDELTSELSPIPLTVLEQNFLPLESIAKGQPCINSNYFPTPVTFPQYAYTEEAPRIPIITHSPFLQMKPLIHHNWQGIPLNIQNIFQGFPPVAENTPIPFISHALEPLSPEEFKLLLDLTSQSNLYPQLSNPKMFRPGEAITPSSDWTIPSQILPADKYIPLLPKKSPIPLPSDLKSTVCDTEYNPVVVDDIMSLINENGHQILKDMSYSQYFVPPTISEFERDDIRSPPLLDYVKTKPVLPEPFNNAMNPSSFYNPHIGMYNPQNIPNMEHAPYIPPYNLQLYPNLPEETLFSEIIEPAPKLISLPTQSPNVVLEPQWRNIPQFIESVANPLLEIEYLQQLLSKPCLDSRIVLPSSALEAMLKLPTASNKLTDAPCQSKPVYFPAISPMYSTSLSNLLTRPLLPSYASPLSVSSAKAISTPSTSLPLDLPYPASPIASPTLSINPYITSPLTSEFPSPLMPIKTELSDYYLPKVAQNRPIPSAVPYKPCHTYSSPYLPVQPSSMPIESSTYSPSISKPAPTMKYSPAYSQPIPAPYFRPAPKSWGDLRSPVYSDTVTPVSASPIAPTQTSILSPAYVSSDPSFGYTPIPETNTQQRPSSCFSPTFLTPISQESPNFPINIRYLPSSSKSSTIPQITNQEFQLLRPMCTMPGSYGSNPFPNANQMLPTSPNIPIPSYSTLVSKLTPFFNSQIKQNIPCGKVIQSKLQTSPLTEEESFYNVIEENIYTHSNVRDKYYQEPNFNYPLESMSYTLAPEKITETFHDEDLIKPEGLVTPSPLTSLASEPSLQKNLYESPFLSPYTSLYRTPCSLPPSLTELQQNIVDNISLMPPSNPLKQPASQPISILSSPLLKPLIPFTPVPNLPILPSPCMHTSLNPYNMLPLNKEPLLSSPCYSTSCQNIATPPIDPRVLKDIISPAFLQVPMNTPFTPVSPITLSQPPSLPVIPNNLTLLPPFNDPKSFVKSLSIPNYNQHSAPIISHFPPIEETITPQSAQNFMKKKPQFSTQYMSSILPAPTTFQNSIPLYETPIHYQPFTTPPTGLVGSAKNIFTSPAVTSPFTVLPSFNNIAEPLSTNLYKPKCAFPKSISSPIPVSSPMVPLSTCLPATTPKTTKQAVTNHIIPSSLFMIPETARYTSQKKLSPPHNIPRYNLPSGSFVEPLETVPYETISSPLGNTVLPQNILKPNRQFSSDQFKVPPSSSPCLTRALQPIDSYPADPIKIQYSTKPHLKLSPVSTQYPPNILSPSLTPSFTPLPLETVPNRLINKPQFSLPSFPIYDKQIHTSSSVRNPFLNPNFKPIPEVPSYPIPNISSPKITPVDISQNPFESYSKFTSLPPLHWSSLLKPLAKTFPQKSRLHQPEINLTDSQYESSIESIPQLLTSTGSILNSPLIKPLVTNSQNIAPIFPMHLSRLNAVSPVSTPTNYIPSVTDNYLFPGLSTSLLSESPETAEQLNLLPTPPYSLFKSRINKLQETPATMANMPLYSNYDILEPLPERTLEVNIENIAKPIEVTALHSSLLSRDSFDPEIIEEIEPRPDSKYRLLPLPMNLSQQRQFSPAYTSILKPRSKYKSSMSRPSFSELSLIPEDVELIDTTDFSPLSQIKSEPLIADYSPADRQKFSSYSTLLNTEATSPTTMTLPPNVRASNYSNQFPRLPPLFLSPQEYKELIQGLSISDGSSSTSPSSNSLTSINTEPQLVASQLTGRPRPVPLYTSPISSKPGSWLQSPTLEKDLLPQEMPINVTPEQTLLNKNRLFNKIGVNRYPNELMSPILEVPLEQNIVRPPLIKSGPNTEFEDKYSNDFNEYDSENMPYDNELENICVDENRLGSIEAKFLTETLPEIVEGLEIPNYNKMRQRPQRLSKLNNFYANNHIGQSPQVFTVPTYKTLPTDLKSSSTTIPPKNFKEITNIPAKQFGAIPKLDTASQIRPDDYYPENEKSPINVPIMNSQLETSLNPYIKPYSQRIFPPNAIEMADTSEMPYQSTSYILDKNIDGIKYSGYKTYQIPSLKTFKSTQNVGPPNQINDPTALPYSPTILASKHSEVQQNPSNFHLHKPTQIHELQNTQSQMQVDMTTPLQTTLGLDTLQQTQKLNQYGPLIPQYQTPVDMRTPLQRKLELNTLQEIPEYDKYNPIEDIPTSVENINEDNELNASLINYINNRGDIKNNLDNNDGELTIPIGNIAITKKEPYNSETIETNNPSIGLKVWKSNVKIAQAELKLKFKDLSVNNFMPVVNNLDKYDMDEIRNIVKNYIDEKYGAHIEVNVPYTIDNKYSIIKDFDHDAVQNKYNLLWPTHYV